mmetsp:Transcript_3142/g.4616  ORF Transcript_3142/g.4616 Transcript_3142/m.4616 type:complete len:120 (-) Transcript_3142:67-426(-)
MVKNQRPKSRIKRRPKEVSAPPVRTIDVVMSTNTRPSTTASTVGLSKSTSYVTLSTAENSSASDSMHSHGHENPDKLSSHFFSKLGRQKASRRTRSSTSAIDVSASAGVTKKRTTRRWR